MQRTQLSSMISTDIMSKQQSSESFLYSQEQQQICLLHSKIADIICIEDKTLICSKCALFGQHKGHYLQNKRQFQNKIGHLNKQVHNVIKKLIKGQKMISPDVIQSYIQNLFNQKKTSLKIIFRQKLQKQYEKVLQIFKKIQQKTLKNIDDLFNHKKEKIYKETVKNIISICESTDKSYQQCIKFKNALSSKIQTNSMVQKFASYLDPKNQNSQIVKTACISIHQIQYQIKLLKSKTQNLLKEVNIKLDHTKTQQAVLNIQKIVTIQQVTDFKNQQQSLLLNSQKLSEIKRQGSISIRFQFQQENQDINLLDITNQKIIKNTQQNNIQFDYQGSTFTFKDNNEVQKTNTQKKFFKSPIRNKQFNEFYKGDNYKSPEILRNTKARQTSKDKNKTKRTESNNKVKAQIFDQRHNQNYNSDSRNNFGPGVRKSKQFSKSRQKFSPIKSMMSSQIQCLLNLKKKKIQIPQKYEKVFQDLKNDKLQIVDFGGAELGDENIRFLCEQIIKNKNVKVLKLVRNKISDEVFAVLLQCCLRVGIVSLNLGQNNLTQRSLQIIEQCSNLQNSSIKNITLSLNKINRRNVKQRLQTISKKGILISI